MEGGERKGSLVGEMDIRLANSSNLGLTSGSNAGIGLDIRGMLMPLIAKGAEWGVLGVLAETSICGQGFRGEQEATIASIDE